jgi:hypothetical protein
MGTLFGEAPCAEPVIGAAQSGTRKVPSTPTIHGGNR